MAERPPTTASLRSHTRRAAGTWAFPAALWLIAALAAARRARGLDSEGLSSDEAVYLGQGSGLVGDADWSPVRAHPPLLGLLVELLPGASTGELVPRGLCLLFGAAAIVVAGLLGRELSGRAGGLLSAAALAWMPYHGDVTRLALVDVPMATLIAVALLLVVRAGKRERPRLVEAAAVVLGVATLFKGTAALSAAAVLLAVLHGDPPTPWRRSLRSAGWYVGVVGIYPVFLLARGGVGEGAEYLGWQLGRSGGDHLRTYLETVLPRVGAGFVLAAATGCAILLARRRRGAALLALAVALPVTFYALWPVFGYPYLLAVTAPMAALAGAGAATLAHRLLDRPHRRAVLALASAVLLAGMGPGPVAANPPQVPGAAGVPGVREAARWVGRHHSAPVVTAAPWVANVVRHYLPDSSVAALTSPTTDQDRLNPAYRNGENGRLPPGRLVVMWDVWSAHSDPQLAARLMSLVRQREGRVAHVETAETGSGPTVLVVVFVLHS